MPAEIIKASTQESLDIYTIQNHLVFLKDGTCSLVLKTNALNFNLLSEEEQDATIYTYAGLLNSLSFPIQIVIRSQRKNISDYINLLDDGIQKSASQKVKESLLSYRQFVKSLVKENRVLEKRFYIIITFSAIELGISKSTFNPFAKEPQKPPYELEYIEEKAGMALYPRRDHIIRQFARIGLKASQLNTTELVTLFYNIYNQSSTNPLLNPEVKFTLNN
ncbi:hypothetical protein A2572_00795 [Candidatus Collierbacteria bacterium RIFOXYD1_FULL_40_9]|uniref:Uncharacterized protein n=1 Tax=Candidatus Collierbacteria bacterium RIFOXYD1_FULL_40_9 TaxID=1817731 RepID=A0A1F5FVV5_9BACT|nr:MAG: hypothetical protein A2572_00795 [Candidatus Collierbacteria bacterium RIFOXYD1_FULL_40_9]